MAYTAKTRIVADESTSMEDTAAALPATAQAPQENRAPVHGTVWNGVRILIPVLSSIAKKPGFLAQSDEVLRAVNDASSLIVREASLVQKTLGISQGFSIEAVAGLFPALQDHPEWQETGAASTALSRFSTNTEQAMIPVENLRYLAKDLLEDPESAGRRCAHLDRAFQALLPENSDFSGKPYFLSRLSGISPQQLAISWKLADQWMDKEHIPVELAFWDRAPEGRKAREMLHFAVATQFALLHQYINRLEDESPKIRQWVLPDPKKFLQHQQEIWKQQVDTVASWFPEGNSPKDPMEFAQVVSTVLRESGDLLREGIRKLSDNLLRATRPYRSDGDPENPAMNQAMEDFWTHPKTVENVRLAKLRVREQREILLQEDPSPGESGVGKSVAIKTHTAILQGLAPVWGGAKLDLLDRLREHPGGLRAWVDAQARQMHQQARWGAGKVLFSGLQENPMQNAVTESLLREVARQALPDIVLQAKTVSQIDAAMHSVAEETLVIAGKIIQPEQLLREETELRKSFRADFPPMPDFLEEEHQHRVSEKTCEQEAV